MSDDDFRELRHRRDCAREPGAMDFERIRDFFHAKGMLGETLQITHEGNEYRVSCDEGTFSVYRVNHGGGAAYGVPGWPVCLVNSEGVFEEAAHPGIRDDHCSCGTDLQEWISIIDDHCAGRSR
jgi:hypothetical protein